jgi:hypothetical protein
LVQRTTIQLSSTPNADSAFKTIELQPPSSPSPIEEENEEQLSMAFSIQYDVVSSIEQDSFQFRRGKVPPPRITSDSDSSRNEAPSKRRFEETVSENAVFSAEFSSQFEEPVRENAVFSTEFSSHFEEPVRENAVFSAELSSRFEEPVPVREDSYQFNGMIQAASDDEDWEDMDIDPLSPPPKWIVLEKALRK